MQKVQKRSPQFASEIITMHQFHENVLISTQCSLQLHAPRTQSSLDLVDEADKERLKLETAYMIRKAQKQKDTQTLCTSRSLAQLNERRMNRYHLRLATDSPFSSRDLNTSDRSDQPLLKARRISRHNVNY